jgi:RNA polymerase sigma factor (sigma-70 family)
LTPRGVERDPVRMNLATHHLHAGGAHEAVLDPDDAMADPRRDARDAQGFDPEPLRTALHGFFRRRGAETEAEDLVQETFLRGLAAPPPREARSWLFRIAGNLLIDRKRRDRRAAIALDGLAALGRQDQGGHDANSSRAERAASDGELLERARAAIAALPNRQRGALELRVLHDLDYDAVGRRLGCSAATARQHVHLAMKTLRGTLAPARDTHDTPGTEDKGEPR